MMINQWIAGKWWWQIHGFSAFPSAKIGGSRSSRLLKVLLGDPTWGVTISKFGAIGIFKGPIFGSQMISGIFLKLSLCILSYIRCLIIISNIEPFFFRDMWCYISIQVAERTSIKQVFITSRRTPPVGNQPLPGFSTISIGRQWSKERNVQRYLKIYWTRAMKKHPKLWWVYLCFLHSRFRCFKASVCLLSSAADVYPSDMNWAMISSHNFLGKPFQGSRTTFQHRMHFTAWIWRGPMGQYTYPPIDLCLERTFKFVLFEIVHA